MKQEMVRIGKAAELLGVSIDTLRRLDKKGDFLATRLSSDGHRLYDSSEIRKKLSSSKNLQHVAKKWVESQNGFELNPEIYCRTRDIFQLRLESLQSKLNKKNHSNSIVSLVIAIAGEIGNNSFDHNLGNWRDVIGIFFYYDEKNKIIILADRGQGVLKTLKRVKPKLDSDKEAIKLAFTEIISGRQSEDRGNGLKFVKSIILTNPLSLSFQTGNACLQLKQNDKNLSIEEVDFIVKGCFTIIKIGGVL